MTKGHTIDSIRDGLAKGEFSASDIFKEYRNKIEAHKNLNAFLSVFDYRLSTTDYRPELPLAAIPYAVKDNMLIEGTVATAGSKILKNYISAYDATAIRKLKFAGASILGKTNMDEFAMGSSTENSAFGAVKNPWDHSRVPGGSSGGSAAAVAADLCVFALGSDTGGSIRQPAALCGVVGLKPTYGRVSRHGLIAMASSLDQIGPITKNVRDAAKVLNVIAGHDMFDSTVVRDDVPDYARKLEKDIRGLRIGIPKEYFGEGLSKEVEESIRNAISIFRELGAEIVDISLPHSEYALATYYIVMPCEVSANLARFDGIRYGYSANADSLIDVYRNSRADGFGPEPKRRIMLGTYALSSGYYDAYYLKAQKVRARIKEDFDKAFEKVDIIAGPTSPSVAFPIGEKASDPLAMYLSDIYTVPANLAGLPGISIPCGLGKESGLPIGLQLLGRQFDEATLLQAAYQFEKKNES
ncbi:MAG: Asp-tRNA(Asn)/Glu-tRNA(Gln) amidotransferase subunit GatA [Candidatus Yanofskybacteria bacterium]|nr:Asp-tRNA(Asn)/Glu-tRNA(Gln) amidotransferase subunit GatA [Candidatus Yanofskybacteria bacterium]